MTRTNLVRALLCLMVMLGTTLGCKKTELEDVQLNDSNPIKAVSMASTVNAVYIDPTYTGTKMGTITQPFTSFSDVTWKDGGVYLLKCGTVYNTSTKIRPNANNITIGSYGTGNRPIIRSSVSNDKIVDLGSLKNVTVRDLEVESTNKAITCFHFMNSVGGTLLNVKMHGSTWGTRNVNSTGLYRIINCEIYMTYDDGAFNSDIDSIEVSGTYIHDVNQNWYVNQTEQYAGGDVLQLVNVKYFNIHNNTLDHSKTGNKFCMITNSSIAGFKSHGKIENNIFRRDNQGILLYMDFAENVLIRYNKFQNAEIAIYNHSAAEQVYYNEFSNISDKVLAGGGPSGSPSKFINNTFYNINIGIQSYTESVTFQNNIVYNCKGKLFDGGSNIKPDYNCYYQSTQTGGSNSISADPQLVNAAGGDFTLKSTSPCINKGTNYLGSYLDMNQVVVPTNGTTDIGAHEYGSITTTPPPATGQAPKVSITSPVTGLSIVAPATITCTANASDADGSISKVEFFYGSTKIGEKTTSPYSVSWSNVAAGNYVLTAVATDNSGLKTTSSPVNVTVTSATTTPPSTTGSGAVVYQDGNFTGVSAVLAPGDYTMAALNSKGIGNDKISSIKTNGYKVIAYASDNFTGTSITLTSDISSLSTVGMNDQISSLKVVSTTTTTTTTPTTTTTNKLPTVSVTAPSNGQNFTAPATISLAATASDTDGSIVKVEFYNGTTKIGEDTTAPYTFSWSNVPFGKYQITAIATDNSGGKTTSSIIYIYVN